MFSSVRFCLFVALGAMFLAMCPSLPVAAQQNTGNGSLSGPHFDLNLIGRKNAYPGGDKSGGSVIFCWQDGTSTILLKPGPFQVLDANATDADGGSFQLPAPVSGSFTYTVWIRVVGTPGGNGKIAPCTTDPMTNLPICSIGKLTMRAKGQSKFKNVSADLLFVTIGTTTVPIFDASLQDSFWQYDNNGQKVVQMRFYQQPQ